MTRWRPAGREALACVKCGAIFVETLGLSANINIAAEAYRRKLVVQKNAKARYSGVCDYATEHQR